MTLGSQNRFPILRFLEEASTPSTPPTGEVHLWVDEATKHLWQIDDTGATLDLTDTGSALDWGEAGDISTAAYDDVPAAGVLNEIARADHVHGMPSAGGGGAAEDPITDIFGAADTAFEFASSSLAGLTTLGGSPDVEDADTTVPDCLFYRDDASGTAWVGRYLAAPSFPFTAIVKVADWNFTNDYNAAGVLVGVASPATGAFVTCCVTHNGGRKYNAEKLTNRTTFGSTIGTSSHVPAPSPFLAIVANSTTDLDFLYSATGRVWRKFVDAYNPSLTLASVGLAMKSENSAGAAAAFDYLRIWNSALTFPGAV